MTDISSEIQMILLQIQTLNNRLNTMHENLLKSFDKLEKSIDINHDSLIKITDTNHDSLIKVLDNIDECLDAKCRQMYRPF